MSAGGARAVTWGGARGRGGRRAGPACGVRMGVGCGRGVSPADFRAGGGTAGRRRATQARVSSQSGLTASAVRRPAIARIGAAFGLAVRGRAGCARRTTAGLTATRTGGVYSARRLTAAETSF